MFNPGPTTYFTAKKQNKQKKQQQKTQLYAVMMIHLQF